MIFKRVLCILSFSFFLSQLSLAQENLNLNAENLKCASLFEAPKKSSFLKKIKGLFFESKTSKPIVPDTQTEPELKPKEESVPAPETQVEEDKDPLNFARRKRSVNNEADQVKNFSKSKIKSKFYDRHEISYYQELVYDEISSEGYSYSHVKPKEIPNISLSELEQQSKSGLKKLTVFTENTNSKENSVNAKKDVVLSIPFGYEVVGFYDKNITKSQASLKSYNGIIRAQFLKDTELHLMLQHTPAKELSPQEIYELTKVSRPVDLERLPNELREFIKTLKYYHSTNHFDEMQIAHELADFIKSHFKYQVDTNTESGVLEHCLAGSFQCTGAALILANLLRYEFHIPCHIITGRLAVYDPKKPDVSLLTTDLTGHAYVSVYNNRLKNFTILDATPSEATRDFKNAQSNSKYQSHGPSAVPSSSDKSDGKSGSGSGSSSGKNSESGSGSQSDWISKIKGSNSSKKLSLSELLKTAEKSISQDKKTGSNSGTDLSDPHHTSPEHSLSQMELENAIKIIKQLSSQLDKDLKSEFQKLKSTYKNPESIHENHKRLMFFYQEAKLRLGMDPNLSESEKAELQDFILKSELVLDKMKRDQSDKSLNVLDSHLPGKLTQELRRSNPNSIIFERLSSLSQLIPLEMLFKKHWVREETQANYLERSFQAQRRSQQEYFRPDDYDAIEYFERDGYSSDLDDVRLQNGDMRAKRYTQKKSKTIIKNHEKIRSAHYILLDLSLSMSDESMHRVGDKKEHRDLMREYLTAAMVDRIFSQAGEHIIHVVGFAGSIVFDTKIANKQDAQKYIAMILSNPNEAYYAAHRATALLRAIKYSFRSFLDSKLDLDSINFHVVTDDDENMDTREIFELNSLIPSGIKLGMSAFAVAKENKALKTYISAAREKKILDVSLYEHLSIDRIKEILSAKLGQNDQALDDILLGDPKILLGLPDRYF